MCEIGFMSVLPPIEEKAAYVEHMFSRIAPGYDRMNRILTLGMDSSWRELAVAGVAPPARGRALDVGCGTGDFLPLLAGWACEGLVVGVDYTMPMMQAGRAKLNGVADRASFIGGDALRLPFPDETFDVVTTGFMLRNVTDIGQAFREMWRVAQPGAVVACLEVARPRNPLFRLGHQVYFERLVPRLARLLGADALAYTYLPQSARHFPAPDELARIMERAGWVEVRYQLLGMGAAALHIGYRR
jgi:demethylmenaquinone methyltransferase/2-methoxy-6-polyprenyl-1,4-benzoquinol methylase